MSVVTLSPIALESPSPMITSVTPTMDRTLCAASEQASSPGPSPRACPGWGPLPGAGSRSCRAPPLHTGADWKVVLHLPELQAWLGATGLRVSQLSQSVGQDAQGRHAHAHLVQLKDICEDISDHVEQIHALLETEFSLKLLSYSVNIIVDIRTVQLLWHQLRVSVLVLKERLLHGLQDSNGNYTHTHAEHTSEDQQSRLGELTELDVSGQLTIRCSQDYFSLDCGITATELAACSPCSEPDAPRDPQQDNQDRSAELHNGEMEEMAMPLEPLSHIHSPASVPIMQCGSSNHSDDSTLSGHPLPCGLGDGLPPSQPGLPQMGYGPGTGSACPPAGLQFQAEMSRSSPPILEPPDRSSFWLELDSVYPESVSQCLDCLQAMNKQNLERCLQCSREAGQSEVSAQERNSSVARAGADGDRPPQEPAPQRHLSETTTPPTHADAREHEAKGSEQQISPNRRPWYGSEEFLALPAQLHQTEMLALKLESLAQVLPLVVSRQGCPQDIDDWDLTDLNPYWEAVRTDNEGHSPPPPHLTSNRRSFLVSRFSPSSSSDAAPSLDESMESGPLSDLPSEDDGRSSVATDSSVGAGLKAVDCPMRAGKARAQPTAPPVDPGGSTALVTQLLEDIKQRDKDPDIWKKLEVFIGDLGVFISWLKEALDDTSNWTPPIQEVESLRVYLDTHLSFKLNVDARRALKERLIEEGRVLLSVITSNTGLIDILQMVSSQWEQLQRQVRRQHDWLVRALRSTRLLLAQSLQEQPTANQQAVWPQGSPKAEAQQGVLEQMPVRLSSLHYTSPTYRGHYSQVAPSFSLEDFEAEQRELCDWLTDMEAMAIDSLDVMMSEEQENHLYKVSRLELRVMRTRLSALRGGAKSLKMGVASLPEDFDHGMQFLSQRFARLQSVLSEAPRGRSGSGRRPCGEAELSPLSQALVHQLEVRVREMKAWLRDTELLIFSRCSLAQGEEGEAAPLAQLESLQSVCEEVRRRHRGVSSVLRLCHKLLQHSQAEEGPDGQQQREALQLLSINLERRWEAIVMQTLQWETRLRRELGDSQVPLNVLEAGLSVLDQESPVAPPDDSWEWDETDMAIPETEPEPDLTQNLPTAPMRRAQPGLPSNQATAAPVAPGDATQVFSLHGAQLYAQPPFPWQHGKRREGPGKDSSSLSSYPASPLGSLPDLLQGGMALAGGGRGSSQSGSEVWIVGGAGGWGDGGAKGPTGMTLQRQRVEEQDDKEEEEERVEQGGTRDVREEREGEGRREEEEERIKRRLDGGGGVVSLPPEEEAEDDDDEYDLPGVRGQEAGSSLESLLALGAELFPTGSSPSPSPWGSPGQRRASVGSWGSNLWLEEVQGEGLGPGGQLSRQTEELLKRLEEVRSSPAPPGRLTRSASASAGLHPSPPHPRLPASPSLGVARRRRGQLLNPPGEPAAVVAVAGDDGAGLSMVVNVSCASSAACTDEDEDEDDGGDLLSSSTLTLTEEELGRHGDEEEEEGEVGEGEGCPVSWPGRPAHASYRAEAGLRDELQCGAFLSSPSCSSCSSSCSSQDQQEQRSLTRAALKLLEARVADGDSKTRGETVEKEEERRRRSTTRSYISRFIDDVENGNVEQGILGGDEDEELLRDESSVFTKRRETSGAGQGSLGGSLGSLNEHRMTDGDSPSSGRPRPFSSRALSLADQLRGELPCSSRSPPTAREERRAITVQEGFSFSSLVTEESRRRTRDQEVALLALKTRSHTHHQHPQQLSFSSTSSCCERLPPSLRPHGGGDGSQEKQEEKKNGEAGGKENVRDFVKEIVDSFALRSKTCLDRERDRDQVQTSLAHLREKVLEHSHRPLHLQKGDFYSYLSLSSHDSDCGEVPSSSTSPVGDAAPLAPPSPDIRDEEPLFSACVEEVYLGPPLCYSVELERGEPGDHAPNSHLNTFSSFSSSTVSPSFTYSSLSSPPLCLLSSGREARFLWEVIGGEGAAGGGKGSRNEPPPYLNPPALSGLIDSSSAEEEEEGGEERLTDLGASQSNMAAVMGEISVPGADTNPCCAPATPSNPGIKPRAMRRGDREPGEGRGVGGDTLPARRGGRGGDAQKETRAPKQVSRPAQSGVRQVTRTAQGGRSQASVKPPTAKSAFLRRLSAGITPRLQL